MLGASGEMGGVQPPQEVAHAAFVQFDAKLGRNAVPQIGTAEPHNAIAGEIGALLDPGCKLALFDPAQAVWTAASRPVSKPFQSFLIVAMNPVAQRLAVHAAKPRCVLAAEVIEHHGNGQDARCLPGVLASLGRTAQIGGTHILSSNCYRCHLRPPRINADSIDSQNGAEGNTPWRVKTLGPWY